MLEKKGIRKYGVFIVFFMFIGLYVIPSIGGSSFEDNVDWWPMFNHDPQHTGFSTSIAPCTSSISWFYQTGDILFSSPVIVDNKLYVGSIGMEWNSELSFFELLHDAERSSFNDRHKFLDEIFGDILLLQPLHGKVFCFDADTGALIWDFIADGSVYSSPAVFDGKVYFTTIEIEVINQEEVGYIYCIDGTDGKEIWKSPIVCQLCSPVIVDNRLYIASEDGNVYCLDANDGSQIWNYNLEALLVGRGCSLAFYEDKVYVIPFHQMEEVGKWIFCLDAENGDEIWRYFMRTLCYTPVIYDGKVYISSFDWVSGEGFFNCINAETGKDIWNYEFGYHEIIIETIPCVAYGNVYVISSDDNYGVCRFYCFNAETGEIKWNIILEGIYFLPPSGISVADNKIYIMDFFGIIVCYSASDGDLIWSIYTGDLFASVPAIADEKLFVASGMGVVCAFEDPLKIGKIKGGIASVNAEINNIGDSNLSNVNWSVSVTGGLFDFISRSNEGTFTILEADSVESVRAFPILGLGKIDITVAVTAEGIGGTISKTEKGLVLGFLVII